MRCLVCRGPLLMAAEDVGVQITVRAAVFKPNVPPKKKGKGSA